MVSACIRFLGAISYRLSSSYNHIPGQQTAKVSVLWQKCIVGHCLVAEQVTRPAEVDKGVPSPPQG